MKDLNKKQTNNLSELKKGEESMFEKKLPKSTGFEHKIGPAYQQNMIELFNYVYMNPNYFTKEKLAKEFEKGGKTNEQKIIRMVNNINNFCPLIKKTIMDFDGRTHYSVINNISEKIIDGCYRRFPDLSVFYIFLKSLTRIVSVEDVMECLNVKKREAKKILENILDASLYTDCLNEEEDNMSIGFCKFFNY